MAETALQAIYEVVGAELAAVSTPEWNSLHTDYIPASATLPVALITFASGREPQVRQRESGEFLIQVVCVGYDIEVTMAASQQIKVALRDKGSQDDAAYSSPHDDWDITTTTQEGFVHIVDTFSGAQPIFRTGHQFRIILDLEE